MLLERVFSSLGVSSQRLQRGAPRRDALVGENLAQSRPLSRLREPQTHRAALRQAPVDGVNERREAPRANRRRRRAALPLADHRAETFLREPARAPRGEGALDAPPSARRSQNVRDSPLGDPSRPLAKRPPRRPGPRVRERVRGVLRVRDVRRELGAKGVFFRRLRREPRLERRDGRLERRRPPLRLRLRRLRGVRGVRGLVERRRELPRVRLRRARRLEGLAERLRRLRPRRGAVAVARLPVRRLRRLGALEQRRVRRKELSLARRVRLQSAAKRVHLRAEGVVQGRTRTPRARVEDPFVFVSTRERKNLILLFSPRDARKVSRFGPPRGRARRALTPTAVGACVVPEVTAFPRRRFRPSGWRKRREPASRARSPPPRARHLSSARRLARARGGG